MSENVEGVMFATPCYGGQVFAPCFRSYLDLQYSLAHFDFPHDVYLLYNESAVHRARNTCVKTFLEKTDFSHMMFIDADIEFTVEDFDKIWKLEKETECGISVGVYRMKTPTSQYAAWVGGELVTNLEQFTGPTPVDYAGTGFMLISRKCLETIIAAHPELLYEGGQGEMSQVFNFRVENGIELSEDYGFCQYWRDLGNEVMMDPTVKLGHWGTQCFGKKDD